MSRVAAEAGWLASIDATPLHTGQRAGAEKSVAALVGSPLVIERAKALLAQERRLQPLTVRQLRRLLLTAAENPGTLPQVVARRIDAQAQQASLQAGFTFCLDPVPPAPPAAAAVPPPSTPDAQATDRRCARPATPYRVDEILRRSPNLEERARVWTASKEIGRPLKAGLETCRQLRNQVAREMGYSSFFALQVADYGMTVKEMMALLDGTLETTRPLYQGLHCWAKHTLAKRFGRPVPRALPAHWVRNRWAQRWPGLVEEADLDRTSKVASPRPSSPAPSAFYTSLGFPPLPESFWKRSDLYPGARAASRARRTATPPPGTSTASKTSGR